MFGADVAAQSASPDATTVLKPSNQLTGGPPPDMLSRYLKGEASRLLARRRDEVAKLKTPEQISQRQRQLKTFFIDSLGGYPNRLTSPESQEVGTLRGDGYQVVKLILRGRPNHHVPANLYLPGGEPSPYPGVLVPCGHSENGKAYDSYQRICILLARNGIAALCYDPIGQGERVQKLDKEGRPAITQGSTTEHTMAGISSMLVGWQVATHRIYDGLLALDYLASRPDIDANRLGCTGNSGGGTMTAYLMALDERIAVAAPSCYITSLERLFETIGPQDAEQNITGQVAAGMNHADYVTMRAPRPTLLTVGTQDFFDIQGSWDTFREVKLIYGRLGFGERVDLFESDEPHGFTSPRRVATVRWMRRWLLQKDDAITEPFVPVALDKELRCTSTGQVLSSFENEQSVFDQNAEYDAELRPRREAFVRESSTDVFRSKVRELLGLKDWKPQKRLLRVVDQGTLHGLRMRKLTIETDPGIVIPIVELSREGGDSSAPSVVRIGTDRKADLAADGTAVKLAREGRRVILADLRGMGETTPQGGWSGGRGNPLGPEVVEALLSFHIARPLLGQRVADLLCLLDSLAAESGTAGKAGFEVVGEGPAGLVALHAACLDSNRRIQRLSLQHSLISWADVVKNGISRNQIGSVLPGVLKYYDLPDLAAWLKSLPITVRSAVDAMGKPVPAGALESAYAGCKKAHENAGLFAVEAVH
jgi:dienelactone hydrolase